MPRIAYATEEERLAARREANRRYYQRNREIRIAKQKEYDEQHREQIRKKDRERWAKKKAEANNLN